MMHKKKKVTFNYNKAKRIAKQQRSDVLICFCLLASRRSDRVKKLMQKIKLLHRSVVNSGGTAVKNRVEGEGGNPSLVGKIDTHPQERKPRW